jgi:hypothetical protein
MAYNGPGQPEPGAGQRTTYTLGDNISSIVLGSYKGENNVGSGRVVGFVIKLDRPIQGQGRGRWGQNDAPDKNYVISSSEQIMKENISTDSVARMSGGKYKKSHKTRKNNSRRR